MVRDNDGGSYQWKLLKLVAEEIDISIYVKDFVFKYLRLKILNVHVLDILY